MAHVKQMKQFETPPDYVGFLNYLGNETQENHIFYRVLPVRYGGGQNAANFLQEGEFLIRVYNRGRSSMHHVRTCGLGFIITFAPGSNLTREERKEIEKIVLKLLSPDGRYALAWHLHFFSGEADLNVVVHPVVAGEVPRLRRHRAVNLHQRLNYALADLTGELNAKRAAAGKPMIPQMMTLRPGRRLAAQVIEAAKKAKVEPTKATLGPLFIFSGLGHEGWILRGNHGVNSKKRPGKKPLPDLSVDELLWEVAILTWPQQPVAQEKREMPTREVGSQQVARK